MAVVARALTGWLAFTATVAGHLLALAVSDAIPPSASAGAEIARAANVVWRDALWADDGTRSIIAHRTALQKSCFLHQCI
jgi:hypothetical protein